MFAHKHALTLLAGAAVLTSVVVFAAEPKHPVFNFSGPVPPQFIISPQDGARSHDHISIAADVAERLPISARRTRRSITARRPS